VSGLPDHDGRNNHVGDGSTLGPWAYGFKIWDKTELEVIADGVTLVLDVDYTVTGAGVDGGGTITTTVAVANGKPLAIMRKQPVSVTSVYQSGEDFPSLRIQKDFEKAGFVSQMLREALGRAIKFGKKSLKKDIDIDDVGSTVDGKFAYWDNAANRIKWAVMALAGTLPDPVSIGKGGTGVAAATIQDLLNAIELTNNSAGRGKISAAPNSAQFIVLAAHGELTVERVITAGVGISIVDGGAGGALTISSTASRGYLWGMKFANNGVDATNDIDIGAGECISDDALAANRVLLAPGAMTKQIDAAWAAGTGAGMRVGALADGVWHCYAFRRSGGADDIFAEQSLAPTVPDGGTKKRRIFSFRREGGVIVPITQVGRYFIRKTPVLTIDTNPANTNAVVHTLAVITGLSHVQALINVMVGNHASSAVGAYISPVAAVDLAPSSTASPLNTLRAGAQNTFAAQAMMLPVSTTGTIRSRVSATDGSTKLMIADRGWYDEAIDE
jgi:hypothetical protein